MTSERLRRSLLIAVTVAGLVLLVGCTGLWSTGSLSGSVDGSSQLATFGKKAVVWHVPGDFTTIQEAIDSTDVRSGDRILIGPGSHSGAEVTKCVDLCGAGRAVIDSGPAHSSGLVQGFRLLAGSGGTIIEHLTFTTDLAIMNGGAVDGVTVTHCSFVNSTQAISDWRGSDWTISHNTIQDLRTRNGGGIGILVADYAGGEVAGNLVEHNAIEGTVHVWPNDGGGYNGSGIVLYADFRWGWAGAAEISDNHVLHNTVSLTSDAPDVVDVAAFELTDTRDDPALPPVLFDNAIGFNDFRGTAIQIALTPEELAASNTLSRNLGGNRGHGAHPSLLKP